MLTCFLGPGGVLGLFVGSVFVGTIPLTTEELDVAPIYVSRR